MRNGLQKTFFLVSARSTSLPHSPHDDHYITNHFSGEGRLNKSSCFGKTRSNGDKKCVKGSLLPFVQRCYTYYVINGMILDHQEGNNMHHYLLKCHFYFFSLACQCLMMFCQLRTQLYKPLSVFGGLLYSSGTHFCLFFWLF